MIKNNIKISTPRHTYKDTNEYQYLRNIEEHITKLIFNYNEDIKYKTSIDKQLIKDDDFLIELDIKIIEIISNKICGIKEIYLKHNDSNTFFDVEAIEQIFSFIVVSIKYYKLINNFRRQKNKDFQPLRSYLNCITSILEKTNNKALKLELQKEYNLLNSIRELHTKYINDDELYGILIDHNILIEQAKDRLPISGAIPIEKLNKKRIKTLSNFIDKQLSSLTKFH